MAARPVGYLGVQVLGLALLNVVGTDSAAVITRGGYAANRVRAVASRGGRSIYRLRRPLRQLFCSEQPEIPRYQYFEVLLCPS